VHDDHADGGVNRRRFLKIGGLTVLGGALALSRPFGGEALAALPAATSPSAGAAAAGRSLLLHNTHTGETGRCIFAAPGGYLADGLARANRLLRDHRTGDVHTIDPALLDLLHDLAENLDVAPEFEIISGYRSPTTNALLRRHSRGVARRSYHMEGKAVDVRLRGVELSRLHRAALALGRGGVGLYSASGFVHMDTGPVRAW
jgi:uncharacterized protein YcbK (DUF882 family)